ncbi:MAG: hypothetical protein OEZ33_02895 [Gammaproteobacteria bacterium]|nr:hypothetical protein [Gammaproteobacteria bacterium]MDH5777134.1 hypothetical protein [Gammaproteobacteria bacterium]
MTSLFIHPVQLEYLPEKYSQFVEELRAIKLLGEALSKSNEAGFLLGENFFQLISFMGCAPAFKLEPDDENDEQFCHIRLSLFSSPQFRYLRPERPARCPSCRKPGITASEFAHQYESMNGQWPCPACDERHALNKLDWRKEAGLAKFFIEVRDVYPHEGVPTDHLIHKLKELTGQEWCWFYA